MFKGRSCQEFTLSVNLEDMKVASICDLPMGPQKVGSWFDGLMHWRSFDKVKPSKISLKGESSLLQRMLRQFKSPPMTALERWREVRLPSRKARRVEGSVFGGL